jgi:hypothetical protein
MKTSSLPFLLLLCIGLLSWSSCGDDDDLVIDTLNYDGPNFTAPTNGEGFTTFAARFPGAETQAFTGRKLERISFFLEQIPISTVVLVYDIGTDDRTPGDLLYSIDLTQRVRNTGWIEHVLTTPVDITGDGLWLAVETELNTGDQAIGCDQGTNYNPNGDRLLTPANVWTSFNEITGSETINWNIRGIISEE